MTVNSLPILTSKTAFHHQLSPPPYFSMAATTRERLRWLVILDYPVYSFLTVFVQQPTVNADRATAPIQLFSVDRASRFLSRLPGCLLLGEVLASLSSSPRIRIICASVFVFLSCTILDSLGKTDSSYNRCPPSVHCASRINPIIV